IADRIRDRADYDRAERLADAEGDGHGRDRGGPGLRRVVEAYEGGGRADHSEEGDAEHQRRDRQQQRRMPEDRQAGAERIDAEDDRGGEPAAVERQHAPPDPGRDEGADADQAPERALCHRAAATVADIGDHERHVGDVAGAEQEVGGEVDQDRRDRELGPHEAAGGRVGVERRKPQRHGH
ncbi:hypothetical protein chiPu_0032178, partial [Chiloscyllium punctatum]|nr:hypothetical protein [Chiloscyllium punctatum]